MEWTPFPEGTRVKHRDESYEGWIDGLTEVYKGGKVNPDGKSKYRIRLHDHEKRELAAEQLGVPLDVDADRENIYRYLDSIKVVDSSLIRSRVVLLLDDIVTTGTSFMGCRKLLLDAGASEVVCLALGITKRVKGGK